MKKADMRQGMKESPDGDDKKKADRNVPRPSLDFQIVKQID